MKFFRSCPCVLLAACLVAAAHAEEAGNRESTRTFSAGAVVNYESWTPYFNRLLTGKRAKMPSLITEFKEDSVVLVGPVLAWNLSDTLKLSGSCLVSTGKYSFNYKSMGWDLTWWDLAAGRIPELSGNLGQNIGMRRYDTELNAVYRAGNYHSYTVGFRHYYYRSQSGKIANIFPADGIGGFTEYGSQIGGPAAGFLFDVPVWNDIRITGGMSCLMTLGGLSFITRETSRGVPFLTKYSASGTFFAWGFDPRIGLAYRFGSTGIQVAAGLYYRVLWFKYLSGRSDGRNLMYRPRWVEAQGDIRSGAYAEVTCSL